MVFSVTDLDWPSVREHVESRLRKRGTAPAFQVDAFPSG
jgi:hypothetical protein